MKTLTTAEQATLYKALKQDPSPQATFLMLLLETGARVTEALNLKHSDLAGDRLRIAPLKGSNPRTVQLSPDLVQRFQALPALPRRGLGSGAIGTLRRSLCRHFHSLTRTLLGRRLNLHALRHAAISRVYETTQDILATKIWAGHKSLNSTLVYLHEEQRGKADSGNLGSLRALG